MPSQICKGIPVWGEPDWPSVEQMQAVLDHAKRHGEPDALVALMADHHLGYSVPIGGVVGYERHVSPSGVGYDIACGNKAIRLDADPRLVMSHLEEIMEAVYEDIAFGVGRSNECHDQVRTTLWNTLKDHSAWDQPCIKPLKDMAEAQLGTVGSGNHYVDLFIGDDEHVWVGCHFGSRGLGHKIATHFIREGGGSDGIHATPVLFDVDSEIGNDYLEGMHLAGLYAHAGRDWVCAKVLSIINDEIGGDPRALRTVHNHHNYCWYEKHNGRALYVVRKGATPNHHGQFGFIGGSMGDQSAVTVGAEFGEPQPGTGYRPDLAEAQLSLRSTVHGAGRCMSRGQAKRTLHPDEVDGWINTFASKEGHPLVIRGGGLDEAPQAYKRLPEVLAEHAETTRILVNLTPIGVAMAGKDFV